MRRLTFATLLSASLASLAACSNGPNIRYSSRDAGSLPDGATSPDAGGLLPLPSTLDTLALGVATPGSSGLGAAHGYTLDVPSSGQYAFVLERASYGATASVYADTTRAVLQGSCVADLQATACAITLDAGTHYVEVADPDGFATTYTITVLAFASEGTAASPVNLDTADPSLLHGLPIGGVSYYSFTLTKSGAAEAVLDLLTAVPFGTELWTMEWYRGADFASTSIATCASSLPTYCHDDDLPSGVYGLRMSYAMGDPSVFRISARATLAEGADVDPVPLATGASHDGGVDYWSRSFYRFTTDARAGGYAFSFGHPTWQYQIDVYANPTDTTPIRQCLGADGCVISGLEPNIAYPMRIQIAYPYGSGGAYSLAATEAYAEGSAGSPVVLADGVAHASSLEQAATSYYVFVPSVSGYYDLTTDAPVASGFDFSIVSPPIGFAFYGSTASLGPLVAGTPYIITTSNGAGVGTVSYSFTIAREPLGEGILADPYPLSFGVARATTLNPSHGNDYRVDLGGTSRRVGIAVHAGQQVTVSPAAGAQVLDCRSTAAITVCETTNAVTTATYDFHVAFQLGYQGVPDMTIEVFDLGNAAPCNPNAVACYTFESGLPAAITEPASSVKPWSVTTASADTGTYGFSAATNGSPSCFEYSTSVGSLASVFSIDVASTSTSDQVIVATDGTNSFWFSPNTLGFQRHLVGFDPTSSHVITVCLTTVGSGSRHAYVDDLEID